MIKVLLRSLGIGCVNSLNLFSKGTWLRSMLVFQSAKILFFTGFFLFFLKVSVLHLS